MNYIVYDNSGEILRIVVCSPAMSSLQARGGKFVMEGIANGSTQKIEFDGLDEKGRPINPRVINKSPEEIEADNPTPSEISFEKRIAHITNEQWQDILDRLDKLDPPG